MRCLFAIMAGHSKFKNIMHRKGAQDKKRAKIFSRLGREITVSVRSGGPDQESNIRLRSAILSSSLTSVAVSPSFECACT